MNKETVAKNLKNVQDVINKYSHWIVWYMGDENDPKVVHMSSFTQEPSILDIEKARSDLKSNPKFLLSNDSIDKLNVMQISQELAAEIVMDNLKDLSYQQSTK